MVTIELNQFPTVTTADFLPEILLISKGAGEDIAEYFLYDTIVDFCEQTHILQREVEVDLLPEEEEYYLDIPECERILRFESICIGAHKLDLNALRNDKCWEGKCRGGYGVRFVPPNTLMIRPTSHSGGSCKLQAVVATAPKRDNLSIPEELYERYRSTIIAGTLGKLLIVPDINNNELAKFYMSKYEQGVMTANRIRLLNYSNGLIKMKRNRLL